MKTTTNKALIALTAASLGLSLVTACTSPAPDNGKGTPANVNRPNTTSASAALTPFESCGEMRGYMEELVLEELVQQQANGYYYGDDFGGNNAAEGNNGGEAQAASGDSAGGGSAPSDYTTTNVQEEGVDEADFVKTDGTHIYIVQNNKLSVLKSWPASETALIGELELPGYPHTMFLRGDRVVVMSHIYGYDDSTTFEMNSFGGTRVTTIDVSDPTAPTTLRDIDVEGYFAQGRMIDGDVYLVLNADMPMPGGLYDLLWDGELELPTLDWDRTQEEQEAHVDTVRELLRPHVAEVMRDVDLDELLPRYRGDRDAEPTRLIDCASMYRPSNLAHRGVLSIMHIDLDDDNAAPTATGVLAGGWNVYASKENLYVGMTNWGWYWGWGTIDRLETHIHKFELLGDAGSRYAASGQVDGWLLNQFSFSEFEGHLRVATTDNDWWFGTQDEQEGGNHITVLAQEGGALVETGSIRDIAPGEEITAARMMGKKGYLVTFEQVDPLFTIDLSDHAAPRLVGELKIPGFSSYLHPVGDDHLLAVGMDGTDEGQITGMQVSIFDVSDFANPRQAHKLTITEDGWGSWSEALWNHHAFTYSKGTLSIPASQYSFEEETGYYRYDSGLLVLDIDLEEGISQRGFINHTSLLEQTPCPYELDEWTSEEDLEWYCNDYYYGGWGTELRRSIYIEDALFSISTAGVKVNMLDTPEMLLAEVPLNR